MKFKRENFNQLTMIGPVATYTTADTVVYKQTHDNTKKTLSSDSRLVAKKDSGKNKKY